MNTAVQIRKIKNPFPGLRPFNEGEEHLFFGREKQTDALVNELASTRFLAVIGSSGSGKSSLVNCGLRVALRSGLMPNAGTSWRMAQCRPGGSPIASLARALAKPGVLFDSFDSESLPLVDILDANLRMSKLGIIDVFEQAHLDEHVNLLVVIDQFEELFRYTNAASADENGYSPVQEEATAFINLLLAVRAQTTHPVYIVLTMRSDFLGDCTHFDGLTEAINEGQYLVPRMTREERRMAISGPIGVNGAQIDPLLLTRLVNDLGDNPDQLSILQHALNRIWASWEKQKDPESTIGLQQYNAIGSMSCALDQHAEQAFAELDASREQLICERLFKALTNKSTDTRGVRRPTRLAMLCELTDASPDELRRVIDVFRKPSRSFLMPPIQDRLHEDSVIDISHESLMRMWVRLDHWADEEAQSTQIYMRLAQTAALHSEGQAGLWRDPDLQRALEWRMRNDPNQTWASRISPGFNQAMKFLDDSRATSDVEKANELKMAEQERELERSRAITDEQFKRLKAQSVAARRLKQVIGLISGGLIVTLGLSLFSYSQYKTAETQRLLAEHQTDLAEQNSRAAAIAQSEALEAQSKKGEVVNEKATVVKNLVEKTGALDEKTRAESRLREMTQDFQKIAERMWLVQSGGDVMVETNPAMVAIDNQTNDRLMLLLLDAAGVQSEPQLIIPGQQLNLQGVVDQLWMARKIDNKAIDDKAKIIHFGIMSSPENTFIFETSTP